MTPADAGGRVDESDQPVAGHGTGVLGDRVRELAEAQRLARVGSWSWDLSSGAMTWSDELYRIVGLAPDTAQPSLEAFLTRVRPDHRAAVDAAVHAALQDAGPVEYECPLLLPDATERWVRCRGELVRERRGRRTRLHGTVQAVPTVDVDEPAGRSAGTRPGPYDPLTGLVSRTLMTDQAQSALARSARQGRFTAVLVVDLDRFRDVNEAFGHDAGDELLTQVARRLEAVFRPYDTVARPGSTVSRLGGDEYVLVCEEVADIEAGRALAQRVTVALEPPFSLSAGEVAVTAAIGVVLAAPGRTDIGRLIVEADTAMRAAKTRGAGACEVHNEGVEHRDAERELRRALDEGQLRLVYQPKVAVDTGRLVGVEALLRWDHPTRGSVPPNDFIPLAEVSGLIVPIGVWVIEEACRQAARWRAAFPRRPALVMCVNVSAAQFRPGLADVVSRALAAGGVEPSTLCLEVTESALMADVDAAIATMTDLGRLGVPFALDDFGTGYSSLAYVKRLPIQELKIDKSFVDGLGTDPDDTAIVAAVMSMAHALDLRVVAEGVETADQLDRLRTLGCEVVQGYFVGRPGAAAVVDEMISSELAASHRFGQAVVRPSAPAEETYRPDRVLIVDDAPDVLQLARMSLAAVGFEVHEAVDGAGGLAAARRVAPDCILLDVSMPDMDGFAVCRALRADPVTAAGTIVMLTSNAEASDKVEAYRAGADDYIVKPFSPRDLASRVRAAMSRRERSGSRSPEAP